MTNRKIFVAATMIAFLTAGATAAHAQAAKKATAPGQGTHTGQNVYKKTNPNAQAGKGVKPSKSKVKKTRINPSADKSRVYKKTSQSKGVNTSVKPTAKGLKAVKSYNRTPSQENPGVNTKTR